MLDPKGLELPWTTEIDLPYGEQPRIYDATGALVAVVGNAEVDKQDDWERNAAAIAIAVNALSTVTPAEVGGLVAELRDEDFRHEMQHLRSSSEIDRLFQAAASLIQSQAAESTADKARIAELEAALKPFARIAEAEDFAGTKDGGSILVNVNLCRIARSSWIGNR